MKEMLIQANVKSFYASNGAIRKKHKFLPPSLLRIVSLGLMGGWKRKRQSKICNQDEDLLF